MAKPERGNKPLIRFECDYLEGADEEVLSALVHTNAEQTAGYSEDAYCDQARALIQEQCRLPASEVHYFTGGTQVNTTVIAAALRPARADLRRAYSQTLAQRNNLLARIRRGGDPATLAAWDRELAERAAPLVEARAEAASELTEPFVEAASELGLAGGADIAYRPRTGELDVEGIVAE